MLFKTSKGTDRVDQIYVTQDGTEVAYTSPNFYTFRDGTEVNDKNYEIYEDTSYMSYVLELNDTFLDECRQEESEE